MPPFPGSLRTGIASLMFDVHDAAPALPPTWNSQSAAFSRPILERLTRPTIISSPQSQKPLFENAYPYSPTFAGAAPLRPNSTKYGVANLLPGNIGAW